MLDNKTKSSIINFIRLSFRQSKQCQDALKESIHPTVFGPRGGKRYKCASCGNGFNSSEVQIDHIMPVCFNKKQKDMTISEYVDRLYCNVHNLQVLCKDCHKIKTNRERHEN